MANPEHVERLIRSVTEWNQWRQEHPHFYPDLHGDLLNPTNLSGTDLNGANLSNANLSGASLDRANLSGANLSDANLSVTSLDRANLSRANLIRANLSGATLYEANLCNAGLYGTVFKGTNLCRTDLTNVHLGSTMFVNIDLSEVQSLDMAVHDGSSTVDIISVVFPQNESIRKHFLRGIGFPDTLIDYLPSLLRTPIQYHSLFLSYSHLDHVFTKQLYDDLQNQSVRCWFAHHDLRPGTPMVRGIEEAVYLHEKLLLILSKDAIKSNWVQQEVEAALYKEATTGQEILFPIRLDNTILESETLWAQRLRQRHIADFTNWQDEVAYQEAFTTLLQHLKVSKH